MQKQSWFHKECKTDADGQMIVTQVSERGAQPALVRHYAIKHVLAMTYSTGKLNRQLMSTDWTKRWQGMLVNIRGKMVHIRNTPFTVPRIVCNCGLFENTHTQAKSSTLEEELCGEGIQKIQKRPCKWPTHRNTTLSRLKGYSMMPVVGTRTRSTSWVSGTYPLAPMRSSASK